MDPIKEAFSKIKEDMLSLRDEISQLRLQIENIQTNPTHNIQPTHKPTNTPTHNKSIEALYTPNPNSSIGNEGVPTHKPTNTQTNQQTFNYVQNAPNSDFKQASDILSSLDSIKKGIRLKFKRLTPQEMLVFSVLYTLEEQNYKNITHRAIASQVNLSESSIRDYINKLINKGVPIEKIKQNNKTINLKISQDLKDIATLTTIQNLRNL